MSSRSESHVLQTMEEVARSLKSPHGRRPSLATITYAAAETIPSIDHASVSIVHSDGAVETLAPTDRFVIEADQLQYDLGEGPCLDVALGAALTCTTDMANDHRWPEYGPRAAAMGIGSHIALRLYEARGDSGALNLYATAVGPISDTTLEFAQMFAVSAAEALGHAGTTGTPTTRHAINQALGLVMERYDLNQNGAFELLLRVYKDSHINLHNVAAEIVQTADAKGRAPAKAHPTGFVPIQSVDI